MPVKVKTWGGPSTVATIPTFTDNFNRVGNLLQTYPWQLWGSPAQWRVASNFPTNTFNALFSGLFTTGTVLSIDATGAAGVVYFFKSWLTPAPFWGTDFVASPGHSQFSQYKIVSDNSGSAAPGSKIGVGLGCMCQQVSPNISYGGGYYLEIRGFDLSLQLYRNLGDNGNGGDVSLAGPVAGAFGFGDTVRLECVVAAGNNTLTAKVNGAAVAGITSIVDSDATRPRFGPPGIGLSYQDSNAFFITIDDYSGGPL